MKRIILLAILTTANYMYLTAQEMNPDSVTVTFNIAVPESTPSGDGIFWAGTLNRWNPGNEGSGFGAGGLSKPAVFRNGIWSVKLTGERGDKAYYKYTRGSIFSVEEQPDYNYREPRSVLFDREKTVQDTIDVWHDIPPEALEGLWPVVKLETAADLNITYDGIPMQGSGTLLYDRDMLSNFYDPGEWNTEINGVPEMLTNPVYYFQRVSYAPDNTVLVVAGQTNNTAEWNIYVDQNNDNSIDHSEFVFATTDSMAHQNHITHVQIEQLKDGEPVTVTVPFSIARPADLPPGYRSSAVAEAPDLTYELPFKNRVGMLNGRNFYLSTLFELQFREFHQVMVDYNHNDTLEIGSGSNEAVALDLTQMYREQKFYVHPSFTLGDDSWEVANIDREGNWIRLRPSPAVKRRSLTVGNAAPIWEATTIDNLNIGTEALKGMYVLLDFWGSWCGPCIQAIPKLREVYERFRSKDFTIVGFAYEPKASLQRALETYDLPWPQIADERGVYSSKFLVKGYPTYYLIGPEGKVVAAGADLRGDRLVGTLERVLEQK